ncbi:MAG: CCA tRNA nucleotidyltransferase [Dehalococcoidia bacterium]|nr:CCA tRNA nucleotidyltransferase [Dehalococcoidia bacterium]
MNLARHIEQYLPSPLLELMLHINAEAAERGETLYLVGGIVRDLLLSLSSPGPPTGLRFDLDLVVEGDAVKLATQAATTGRPRLLAHHRFGTAKLKYETFTLDLATARKETYERPGALPRVTPGTLKDDLIRRDFSINAMAMSLATQDYGELIDPHKGKTDLEQGLIRVLHAASFSDDPTRILRAVRYEQRLGFVLEAETAQLLEQSIPMLDAISGDRIRHELEMILREDRPELAINRLGELGALSRIGHILTGDDWLAASFDRARRLKRPAQLPAIYLCLMVYPYHEDEVEQVLTRLSTPAKLSRAIRDTLRLKGRLHLLDRPALKPSEVYDLLQEYDLTAIQASVAASDSPEVRRHLQLFLTKLRHITTLLDGEDLKRLGIPAGPHMGQILQTLRRARLDGEVSTRADEERLASELTQYRSPSAKQEGQGR